MDPSLESSQPSVRTAEQSAIRKASLHLLPLIALGYGCAYMDRSNISYAALQMNGQLHFSPAVYGLGAGLFFLPYAAFEIPSNLLLYRFGARRWLARIMLTWGLIAMAMAFVHNSTEFYVARFFLGLAEAGFFPGVIFYLMLWFPPELRARTISRFYVSLPLSSVLMGLLAGPIMNLNGRLGFGGWQWLFLIEGLPPILLSLALLKLLPDKPADAPWLTPDERSSLTRAVHQPSASQVPTPHSLSSTLKDIRVWQLGLFNLFMIASAYAYGFVAPDLVQRATHRNTAQVGYILAAFYLVGALSMLFSASRSDRTSAATGGRSRFAWIIPCSLLVSAAFVGLGLSEKPGVVLPSLALLIAAYMAIQGPLWAVPCAFLKGRSGAAGVAAINSIGILGGFLGPYWIGFARNLTGNYQRGMLVTAIPMFLGAGIMSWLAMRSVQAERQAGALPTSAPLAPSPAHTEPSLL